MNERTLLVAVALAWVASSTAVLVCCASAESRADDDPEPGDSAIPSSSDGGSNAPPADADVEEPCVPGAFCPVALFGPDAPGGGFDFRTRINLIRGRSSSDVWAAGARGAVAHFDGSSWRRSDIGGLETFHVLWLKDGAEIAMASRSVVYARGISLKDAAVEAGTDPGVRAPSADGWLRHDALVAGPPEVSTEWLLSSGWAESGAEWLWFTTLDGSGGHLARGLSRTHVSPATQALEIGSLGAAGACGPFGCGQMTSVHGASADDLWAVGFRGATFHITGAQSDAPRLTPFDSQTWAGLNGVWAASANDAWAVGGGGVIRHYTGHPFSWDVVTDVPTNEDLHAVWGTSPSDVWAVGDHAVVLHYDGESWSQVRVAGLGRHHPDLHAVWTAAPGEVWVGGDGVLLSLARKP